MSTTPAEPPPRRRRRGTLNPEIILDAALTVVDEVGFEALSMRKLGTSLGVDAMTIYGYFADKAALLDALVGREAARLDDTTIPDGVLPFDALIFVLAHYRRVMLEHPNLAGAVATRPFLRDLWEERVAGAIALLEAGEIPTETIPVAADALATFAMGFVVHEARELHARAEMGEDRDQLRNRFARRLAVLDPEGPEARSYERRIAELDGADVKAETFERGLRALLEGFRAG